MATNKESGPKILIFTTNLISDPAVDMTGLLHKHYPSTTSIIRVPCSSMIRPDYILHALQSGFHGVFVTADGGDCPYTEECPEKTSKRIQEAFNLLETNNIDVNRLKMAAICSVCVEPFIKHVKDFSKKLNDLKSS
ncbi:MAG: hydrogenase iron-sulfur subunit [Candidatus Hodarchaeota archaeon]